MIIVECYADTSLVQTLTSLPREFVIHQIKGKSGVCKQLANSNNRKGLIDEDPRALKNPYELQGVMDNTYSRFDIKHLNYPEQGNELIVLCPKLEDWIIKTARLEHIDLDKHGLPDEPNKLHRIIDQKLGEFRIVLHILMKQQSDRIIALAKLLNIPR